MTKLEQYNLRFGRTNDNEARFTCEQINSSDNYLMLARRLASLSKNECEYLLEEIDAALNGKYYEQYFAVDYDPASDWEYIEITPPNIYIDTIVMPLTDLKEILKECLNFRSL